MFKFMMNVFLHINIVNVINSMRKSYLSLLNKAMFRLIFHDGTGK